MPARRSWSGGPEQTSTWWCYFTVNLVGILVLGLQYSCSFKTDSSLVGLLTFGFFSLGKAAGSYLQVQLSMCDHLSHLKSSTVGMISIRTGIGIDSPKYRIKIKLMY